MSLEPPREPKLPEVKIVLLDEQQPSYHGTLTAALIRSLEQADVARATFSDIVQNLEDEFKNDIAVRFSRNIPSRQLFTNTAHVEALHRTIELEQAPIRDILAVLNKAIDRRQKAEDYWPEGRLNAGIAYAAVGDYHKARRLIEEAVDLFSGRGRTEDDRAV